MSARMAPARIAFGAVLLLNGINHFAGPFLREPTGSHPLAIQLMSALRDSHLLDVVVAIQAAAGALMVAGVAVPFALCVAMPISVCAAFWGVILDHRPLSALLSIALVASNAALMFAYLDAYRGVLRRRALALGEGAQPWAHYDGLFMNPAARTPPAVFAAALAVLLAAFAFYWFLVPNVTGTFALLTMLLPAVLLVIGGIRGFARRA